MSVRLMYEYSPKESDEARRATASCSVLVYNHFKKSVAPPFLREALEQKDRYLAEKTMSI
jgi:hypothetical protein